MLIVTYTQKNVDPEYYILPEMKESILQGDESKAILQIR